MTKAPNFDHVLGPDASRHDVLRAVTDSPIIDNRHGSCNRGNLERLLQLTLLVIGILAVTGTLSLTHAVYSTLGLASAAMLLEVSKGHISHRKLTFFLNVVATAGFIALGVLALQGKIALPELGYGIIGTSLISGSLTLCRKVQVRLQIENWDIRRHRSQSTL